MLMSIILDVDDVLLDFNGVLIGKLQDEKKANPKLSVNDISDWNSSEHPELNERFKYLNKEFFLTQPAYEGAQEFVRELSKYCEIFIHTAVYPEYVPERYKRIIELFPEINPNHILFGSRKDLSHVTFMLDDNADNILSSKADVPILMRRPWNKKLTGLVAANSYNDVITIIKSYIKTYVPRETCKEYDIIALIGPSGSGKNEIANAIAKELNYSIPVSFTTKRTKSKRYEHISLTEFLKKKDSGELLEYSVYGGQYYGLSAEQINNATRPIIVPIDITGAFMLKNMYNVDIVYVDVDKELLVKNILEDEDLLLDEKVNRILSIDAEIRNKRFADYVITDLAELKKLIR